MQNVWPYTATKQSSASYTTGNTVINNISLLQAYLRRAKHKSCSAQKENRSYLLADIIYKKLDKVTPTKSIGLKTFTSNQI